MGHNHKENRPAEYIGTIVCNIILLSIWSRIPGLLPFITDSFNAVLPLYYVSFIVNIFCNVLLLIFDRDLFRAILCLGMNVVSIIVMVTVYYIFPFDFSAYYIDWALILRIVLIVGIFGTAIGSILEFLQVLFGSKKCC